MPEAAMNMLPDVEAKIRALPGNQTCADCSNIKPQWASVSYGSLVCLECSGQHRALGVHLSFVRSVQMDSWTPKQIASMEKSGGNAALVEYLSSRGIDKDWPIAKKYNTKQAAYFKERLSRWVEGKTEPPPDPGRYDPVSGGDALGAEPLPNETPEQYNARQARLREVARERMRQKFGDKGMTGVGSEPSIDNNGIDFSGLGSNAARFVGGAVGGAVTGVGSFLRSNVIENEGLHSTLRDTVGTVGETASGAWSTIRRSLGDSSELVDGIRRNTMAENGALRQGLGWAGGAVGGFIEKASTSLGDFMGEGGDSGGPPLGAPAGAKEPRSGSLCNAGGTQHNRSSGASTSERGRRSFDDDDDWSSFGEAPAPEVAPTPSSEDVQRLAQDLGMKLKAPQPTSSPGRAEAMPVAPGDSVQPGSPGITQGLGGHGGAAAPAAKPKAKAGLPNDDDFFSEFGL